MRLGLAARLLIGAVDAGGASALVVALVVLARGPAPSTVALATAGLVAVATVASWLRPLLLYRGEQSEALHLDEACLVLLVLVAGPALAVATFAVAITVAEALRRRPLAKSAFNCGSAVLAAGTGALVYHLVATGAPSLSPRDLLGATGAALAYFVVNSAALAGVFATTGAPWRDALLDGLDVRVLLVFGSVAVALVSALCVAAAPWSLPLAFVPLVLMRQVLAGHFDARHDRARLSGLLGATLEVHRTMRREEVEARLTSSARSLLRCETAVVLDVAPAAERGLAAPMEAGEERSWLHVEGRSRTEPFDAADLAILDALAAVGAGALQNADLYQEGRRQRERLAALTSSLGEGVCAVDAEGRLTFCNPAAASMLGWDAAGVPWPATPECLLAPSRRALVDQRTVTSYDSRFARADGTTFDVAFTASPIPGEAGPEGAVLVFRDITERKEFEQQLARHAFHDALTGLPNRRLFLESLEHALARAERSSERHAVLVADVDRFKVVNDSLGHHAGDALLLELSRRLVASVRPGDIVARMGADEFAVLLEDVDGVEEVRAVAARIRDALATPCELPDGHEVVASLAMGSSLAESGQSRDDVLHDADAAMLRAKSAHTGTRHEVFDPRAMGARSSARVELEAALRTAVERHELEVFYQPLVDLVDERIVGAEALVRWPHPTRGLLAPVEFIGLAEETGLILPIGEQVLEDACRQARRWREDFGAVLHVGVNLSARQFGDEGLVAAVSRHLGATGADPTQLCLEVTESLAMDDLERTSDVLRRLKGLGVDVAIDDFGTGYSALGYLSRFPIDVVKVDRSFVDGVEGDPVKSAIVRAVLHLSEAIGATTTVEGIETAAQLDHLRSLGCTVAQGYYFARPAPAHALDALLRLSHPGRVPVAVA